MTPGEIWEQKLWLKLVLWIHQQELVSVVAVHKAWGLGGTTLLGRQDGREGEEWRKEVQTPLEKGGAC